MEQALAFVMFAAVAAGTPGPSNVMLTATGALAGVLRGLPCLFGVAAGMGAMLFIVAFGLGAAVLDYPRVVLLAKALGAAFLLWLAWRIATAPPGSEGGEARAVGFLGAFAFQWVNPKSWLVSTSASATYLQPGADRLGQALLVGGLFFAVALCTGFVWLAFGVAMRRLLRSPRSRRAFNAAMGALLALSVLLLVL